MKTNQRKIYIDVLNILATVCVVWIHFGNEVHWYEPTVRWKQACLIQSIAFFAVPVFFMLTGATLLNYRERYDTGKYFRIRFERVFIPYLIWGAVFAIWRMHQGTLQFQIDNPLILIHSIINMYLNNSMEPTYWFFAPLFAIYLSIPAMTYLSKPENKNMLKYLIVVGCMLVSIFPFCHNYISYIFQLPLYWNSSWQIAMIGGYLLFVLTGYYLAHYEISKSKRTWLYIIGLLCLIFRFVAISYYFPLTGEKPVLFFDYLMFPSYFWAVAVFLCVKYCRYDWFEKNDWAKKWAKKLASCSFGVYLMHILILSFMQKFVFLYENALLWHFVCPIICYLICVSIISIVERIPILKNIFP